jgi:endonuclease/exonuclease/phosphatase family metal-dependent hydrolase
MSSIQLKSPANGTTVNIPIGESTTLACSGTFDIPDDGSAKVEVSIDGKVVSTSTDVANRTFSAQVTGTSPSAPVIRSKLHVLKWEVNTHTPDGGYWKESESLISDPVTLTVNSSDPDPLYRIACQCVDAAGKPIGGLTVEAFDQDPRSPDDKLGDTGATDANGNVEFQFKRSTFTEHPGERNPDVYFKITNSGFRLTYELPFEQPKDGVLRNFQPRPAPIIIRIPIKVLKVFAWNIDMATAADPHDAVVGTARVAEQIRAKNPDIVILNEIMKWTGIFGNLNEIEQLALSLGYFHAEGLAADFVELDWEGAPKGYYGGKYVAVLARYPITVVQQIRHGDVFSHFLTIHVAVEIDQVKHHVFSTRLDAYHDSSQIESLITLRDVINAIPTAEPVIIGCDFNSGSARGIVVDPVTQAWFVTNHKVPLHFRDFAVRTKMSNALGGIGWGEYPPDDHIFFRGPYKVIRSEPSAFIPNNPSGHGWVFATLTSLPAMAGFNVHDGALFREASSDPVFVIFGGAKFHVPDPDTLLRLYGGWAGVQIVADGALKDLPQIPCDGTMLRDEQDLSPWLIEGGRRRKMSVLDLINHGGWDHIPAVHAQALDQIPIAA